MAIPRTLGPVIQARAQQLRRQAMVALSELTGATTADGSYPRLVDILHYDGTPITARYITSAITDAVHAMVVLPAYPRANMVTGTAQRGSSAAQAAMLALKHTD